MGAGADPWLRLRGISKSFAGTEALAGADLGVAAGEIVVLLGPSGCGKTTLLRVIAGLEQADAGQITLAGAPLANEPVHERGFGYVFQDYALFPHLNVRQNIAFGLRMAGLGPVERDERVAAMLALVNLSDLADRPVQALSGGERQRVALARSLAPSPRLLLLDEPLGALDRALRERLMLELRAILKTAAADVTAIYVTHDQAEAFAVGDRIAVMRAGRIEQVAAPLDLYQKPRTPFVARFLGMKNVLPATVQTLVPLQLQTDLGPLELRDPAPNGLRAGATVTLLIRPEAGQAAPAKTGTNVVTTQVVGMSFRGRYVLLNLLAAGAVPLQLEIEGAAGLPAVGSQWPVLLAPAGLRLLEAG